MQDARERKLVRVAPQPGAHQRRQAVEQGHGKGAPFDHQWRGDIVPAPRVLGVAQHQRAGIDEQPAIAILRKSGQAIDGGHGNPGAFHRLDQGIGEPLRQLVERHEPVGGIVRAQRRMLPAIAQGNAPQRDPRRPDRPEMDEQFAQDGGGFDRAAGGEADEMIEQAAGPRLVHGAENRRCWRDRAAEPAQQVGTSGKAGQRIGVAGLKTCAQCRVRQPFERACIGPQGIAGTSRKRAAGEHGEARQCKPLRTADLASGRRVAKPPVRAGPGIEQHADDGEIELGTCPRGAVAPAAGKARPAVPSVEHEVPPSRVEGDDEIGIGRSRDLQGEIGRVLEAGEIDPEMRQLVVEAFVQQ